MLVPVFIILGSFILVTLAVLGASYWTYRVAFYSSPLRKENDYDFPDGSDYDACKTGMYPLIDELKAIPFEKVEILSDDGLKLYGRYYHVCDDAPLQIQFHGYRGTAIRDLCGGNKLAREDGFNTLLVDQRAHGNSEGKTITFGIKERQDCLRWIEYAIARFGKEQAIWLSGVSMGAATVLMATELDLPDSVKGVIADSPFSSPEKIVRKVCKEMGYPAWLAMPLIRLGARVFGGFSLRTATAENAVKHARIPILIIHGEADSFVPCDMSRAIHAANPEKIVLETFPNAGHGLSFVTDFERYATAEKSFLDRNRS